MAHFFINRPVFAWVLAIATMLGGVLAITALPISQYPPIAPPSVAITAAYPGASAKTLEDAVTQVIEQKMKGIDKLDYMSSTSQSSGQAEITLTFKAGTNPDIAQVQVQNKLQLAMALLPQEVQAQGVQVTKAVRNFVQVLGFVSEDGSMSRAQLADYVATNVLDGLSRVEGVGEVTLFGAQHAMRIWLNPDKLHTYSLTPADVAVAIRAQNAQISAGQLGGLPSVEDQRINFTVSIQDRLQTPEQFRNILLKVNTDGSTVRLNDVATVELGAENSQVVSRFNAQAAAATAIKLATGANALKTVQAIDDYVKSISPTLPAGMKVVVAFDTTPFVRISIEEVVRTLLEAVVLVFLVMYLFLQNLRATLIPTIAVPVVLLGTFGVLAAFGYSINTLTMFAMVLAIGLLVDDAIVVVENVERIMHEDGLSARDATHLSMTQISGALVGIALVLSAVFVPMAFFGGSTGVIYRQFSITIVSAMVLSVLVALILTPALCATMLKPAKPGHGRRGFFGLFNRGFDRTANGYKTLVGGMTRRWGRSLILYALILGGMVFMFQRLPTGFLPDEDQGILFVQVQLPIGSTQERALGVLERIERHFLETEKDAVESLMAVAGFSFAGSGQNTAMCFVRLKDWSQRKDPGLKVKAVAGRAMAAFSQYRDAQVFAFSPPAVMELGNAVGFDFELQDMAGLGHEKLTAARNQLLGMASGHPDLAMVRPNGLDDTPQYRIDIDWDKAGALGLAVSDVTSVIATAWGSSYVNDFLDKGRVKKVIMQGDAPYRMMPEDLARWHVRGKSGQMVPMSSFATAHWTSGSPRLERYNGVPAMQILGAPAPGKSSGQAMATMETLAKELPEGIGYSWTGLSFQERQAGSQTILLYSLSIIVVFLCLAALYESWSLPASVILVIPIGIAGALAAVSLRGLTNDVYFQVGLLTTMGLAAKNAILIVEFAKSLAESGMDLMQAVTEAARQRLRPILMTSLAFGLGVLPLALSSGAGSGGQNSIGTGVIGGTIASTILGSLLIPVFFVIVARLGLSRKKPKNSTSRVIIPGGHPCED
ncbi:MAG: efflux RND transporter permease subunit [Desulfomicrobium sp.]|nr:efflux RND transporter permease subunit [Pseudomonadota bacterium]MBV1712545.1 efflux RND transporter permease subunit [Desulfomicrobium sp.]MBU4571257.1 efflux RND transporter permease subunit [Pseudomonadota bacterium]MBU4592994.1 efflux RND transporter permease subunit [Pseudomonadota bacterium]MBV1720616.1 efflux RND transporter permease subunit [Desulfomicrobium sp.]